MSKIGRTAYAAAVGMFDGVHLGHRFLISQLRQAAAERHLGTIAFTFSPHPLEIIAPEKAPLLLSDIPSRIARLIDAGADEVRVLQFDYAMQEMSARDFIAFLRDSHNIKMLMLGFNNRIGHDRISDIRQYRAIGNELGVDIMQALPYSGPGAPVSSSAIRSAIARADMSTAADMLGQAYSISGIVVTGRQIGRTIGYPTANIEPTADRQLLPPNGVYAIRVHVGNDTYPAVVNIGRRPTVENDLSAPTTIEAHLIGFDGDLYGRQLTIDFIAHLRNERRFDSIESLGSQLSADVENALQRLTPQ